MRLRCRSRLAARGEDPPGIRAALHPRWIASLFAACWLASGAVPTGPDTHEAGSDSYGQGLALIESGDIQGALSLWIEARENMAGTGVEDPRIARAFVEAVAKYGLEDYEEMSTDMFYWGFSGGPGPPGTDTGEEIRAEGRRTFVLADSLVAEHWAEVGRDDPASLAMAIKRFWIERDPTPSTLVNERLIEHWQRIARARRRFVFNHSSPYRTDDRGTFFVKYGAPDEITRGHASVDAYEEALYGIAGYIRMRVDVSPQFEIWRYATIRPGETTYFLFGNTDGTGPFEHVEGLHRMLPTNARTWAGSRRRFRIADVLQLTYYAELARAGGPFALRYEELDRIWLGSGRGPATGALDAATNRFFTDDNLEARRPRPPTRSEYDDSPKSVLSAQLVRILDGADPRLLALAVSSPRWISGTDPLATAGEFDLGAYTARSTAMVRDGQLDEMLRADMVGANQEGDLFKLVLRHVLAMRHLSIVAEHAVAGGEAEPTRRVLPGHQHFVIGEPLRRGAGETEVSDLLVGLPPQEGYDAGEWEWPLLLATRFWRDDPLRVYFEIYHPTSAPADSLRELELRITIVPGGKLATLDPPTPATIAGGELASIGITLQSRAPNDAHFFDLDLRNEPAGLLWVVIEATDPETGAARFRTTPVTLLEN